MRQRTEACSARYQRHRRASPSTTENAIPSWNRDVSGGSIADPRAIEGDPMPEHPSAPHHLVEEGARLERVATGATWAEGPVWAAAPSCRALQRHPHQPDPGVLGGDRRAHRGQRRRGVHQRPHARSGRARRRGHARRQAARGPARYRRRPRGRAPPDHSRRALRPRAPELPQRCRGGIRRGDLVHRPRLRHQAPRRGPRRGRGVRGPLCVPL